MPPAQSPAGRGGRALGNATTARTLPEGGPRGRVWVVGIFSQAPGSHSAAWTREGWRRESKAPAELGPEQGVGEILVGQRVPAADTEVHLVADHQADARAHAEDVPQSV